MRKALHISFFLLLTTCLSAQNPVYRAAMGAATFTFFYSGPTEIGVGENCEGILDWGHPNTLTVEYDGPGNLIFFDVSSISGGYAIGDLVPEGTTVTISYHAEDDLGNYADYVFSIDFVDNMPPTFDPGLTPPVIVVSCLGNIPGPEELTVPDNCDPSGNSVSVQVSGEAPEDTCVAQTFMRTIIATDIEGNADSMQQEVIVLQDTSSPVITIFPVNDTAPCDLVSFQYPQFLSNGLVHFLAEDDGCNNINYYYIAPTLAEIEDTCGVIEVTFVAEDMCGNTSSAQASFTILDDISPTLTKGTENLTIDCNTPDAMGYIDLWLNEHAGAEAIDACTDVNWSYSPDTIDFSAACNNPITITFTAADDCGNSTSVTAQLEIQDTTAPIINVEPGIVTQSCDSTDAVLQFGDFLDTGSGIVAVDYCSPSMAFTYQYMYHGMTIDKSSLIDSFALSLQSICTDTLIQDSIYSNVTAYIAYRVLISDACGNTVNSDTIHYLLRDTVAPHIISSARDTSFYCDDHDTLIQNITDWYENAGGAVLNEYCGEVHIESNPSFDSLMTLINTGNYACGSGIPIDFRYLDDCGNIAVDSSTVSLTIIDTLPPNVISPARDTLVNCSEGLDSILYEWINDYAFANVADACSEVRWLYYTYRDTAGNYRQGNFQDTTLTHFDFQGCTDSLEITFVYGDACSNIDSMAATFTVIDTIPPQIVNFQDTISVECAAIPDESDLDIIDNCQSQLSIHIVDNATHTGDSTQCTYYNYTIHRQYIISDNCSYTDTFNQVIHVKDKTAPEFVVPDSITVQCGEQFDTAITGVPEQVYDACGSPVTIGYRDSIIHGTCAPTIIRIWELIDVCGNLATQSQWIKVVDTLAPVYLEEPVDTAIYCSVDISTTFESWLKSQLNKNAADSCNIKGRFVAIPGSYDLTEESSFPDSLPLWKDSLLCLAVNGDTIASITVDFALYDSCINVAVYSKTFYVLDTMPPTIQNCPVDTSMNTASDICGAYYKIPAISAADLCMQSLPISHFILNGDTISHDSLAGDSILLDVGTHEISFQAIDCAGNIAQCSWTVTVIDYIPPVLTCSFDSVYVVDGMDCYQNVVLNDFTVEDNCSLDSLSNSYLIITSHGDTLSGSLPLDENITLGIGKHTMTFVVRDASDNIASCTSIIELRDTIAPVAACKPAFITVYPDGQSVQGNAVDFNLSSSDNCDIDTMWISPNSFDCSMAGEQVDVTLYVRDFSGNIDSCMTQGQIEMALVYPEYELDLCNPDTLKLFANPPGGDTTQYIYNWKGPHGFTSTMKNPIIPDIDSSYTGTYVVEISGPTACAITGSVEVHISTLGQAVLSLSTDTLCEGSTLTLQSNSYNGPVVYSWYEGLPPSGILLGTTTVPTYQLNPLLGHHNFYLVVSNDNCASDPSSIEEVDVVEVPEAIVAQAFISVCEGEIIQLSSGNNDPVLTYEWRGPDGFYSSDKNPIVSDSASLAQAGTYTLLVSLGSCHSELASVEVEVKELPPIPSIAGDTIVCQGEEFRLQSQNSIQYDNYIWENSQGQFITTDVPVLIISSATKLDSGLWTVKVTDGTCTSPVSETFLVDVKPLPDVRITVPTTVCELDSIYLSADATGNIEFVWVNPAGDSLEGEEVVFENGGGQYKLIARSIFGCSTVKSFHINVIPQPAITALSSTAPVCIDSLVNITFEPTVFPPDNGNYDYFWIHDSVQIGSDSILQLNNASILDTGMYYLVVGTGTCLSDTFSYHLQMNKVPDKPLIESGNFFCESDSVIITTEQVQGDSVSYIFTVGNEEYSRDNPLLNLGLLAQGSYTVTVQVKRGPCLSAVSDPITIEVGAVPQTNSIQGSQEICAGDTLQLRASGVNGLFTWYFNGDSITTTGRTLIIPNADTSYAGYYTVKQALGDCVSFMSDSFFVNVNQTPPRPVIESILDGICLTDDSAAIEICLTPTSYNNEAQYKWYHLTSGTEIGSFTGDSCHVIQDFADFNDGNNAIYVTADIQGCYAENSDTIQAIVSMPPDELARAGADIYSCDGELPFLNATPTEESRGEWKILTDSTKISSFTDPDAKITHLKTGKNILVWSLSYGLCTDFSTDTIIVFYDVPPRAENDSYVKPYGTTFNMDVLQNDELAGGVKIRIIDDVQNGRTVIGSSSIQYAPMNGFIGKDSLVYEICSVNCPGACSTAKVMIKIGDETLCDVPTIFTPNGDGTNDFFIIQCLSSGTYQNNSLRIFNRYGDEVFSASPYKNRWRGTYNGNPLPVGTYYYLMDFGDGSEIRKGFLTIER